MTRTGELSRQTMTYAAAELWDVDGIKTSIATVAAPVEYDGADLNGAAVSGSGTVWARGNPRTVTITRSSAVGSYTTDPIVLTGRFSGAVVTESLTPADADGGDILKGAQLWDTPPSIAIPAQVDTSGAFSIGVGDIGAKAGLRLNGVALNAAGTLNVQYGRGNDAKDAIPVATAGVGLKLEIAPARVLTDPTLTAPTTVGLTVYSP